MPPRLRYRAGRVLGMSGKLLVAAGKAVADAKELPFGVRELMDAAEEILVITPTLPQRFEWLASATDPGPRAG
jgi:hypothetical protein